MADRISDRGKSPDNTPGPLTEHGLNRFRDLLVDKRKSLKISQAAFSEMLNSQANMKGFHGVKISSGTIQNWEKRNYTSCPDTGNMMFLADFFGLSVEHFVRYLNSDYESVEDYLAENGSTPDISPNVAAELLRKGDWRLREAVVMRTIGELFQSIQNCPKEVKVDEEKVKEFLTEAPRETKVRLLQFLQNDLIGA
ncbi:helix-turn-helix transcriptional regulator [Pannus brasiliensis CCIBt3594]|uniref:Helix-turn-helix transcriptional regulator n=1 Tax=Pannus brasiliensis CCIBt3594 TaxID=1427578 RepID=A0AAW9QUB8_9CHRO